MNIQKSIGFSLIELMIAVVIIAIILAIAMPSYTQHVVAARRAEAQSGLMSLATKMERYFVEHNSYKGATLENIGIKEKTENNFYLLKIAKATDSSYQLEAIPQDAQAKQDKKCGALSLNAQGVKGDTGTGIAADCWM